MKVYNAETNFDSFLHASIYMVYHFTNAISLFMIITNLIPFSVIWLRTLLISIYVKYKKKIKTSLCSATARVDD
jgi:hypothetical protein